MDNKSTDEDANNSTLVTMDSQPKESGVAGLDCPPQLNDSPLGGGDSERVRASGECSTAERAGLELEPPRDAGSECVAELNEPRSGEDGGNSRREGSANKVQPPGSCAGGGDGGGGDEGSFVGDREELSESDYSRIGDDTKVTDTLRSPVAAVGDNSVGEGAPEVVNEDRAHLGSVANVDGAEHAIDGLSRKVRDQKDDLMDQEDIQAAENDEGGSPDIESEAGAPVVEETKIEADLATPEMAKVRGTPPRDVSASITESVAIPHGLKEVHVVEERSILLQEKYFVSLADKEEKTEIKMEVEKVKGVDGKEIMPQKKETADMSVEDVQNLSEEKDVVIDELNKKNVISPSGVVVVTDKVEETRNLPEEKTRNLLEENIPVLDGLEKNDISSASGVTVMAETLEQIRSPTEMEEAAHFIGEQRPEQKREMPVAEEEADEMENDKESLATEKAEMSTGDDKAKKETMSERVDESEEKRTPNRSSIEGRMEMQEENMLFDKAEGRETQERFAVADRTETQEETMVVDEADEGENQERSTAEDRIVTQEQIILVNEEDKKETQERYLVENRKETQEETMLVDNIAEEEVEKKESMPDVVEGIQTEVGENDMEERTGGKNAMADAGEEMEMGEETEGPDETEDAEEADKSAGGKRKRGKGPKIPVGKGTRKKKVEEDVCFICFDGGDLVLCDRRGCPKAYHPSCVGRDEAFFQTKGKWNCGWHLCSKCRKNAQYMCLTCTFSLCKGCIKEAIIFRIRGNKGLCETCMETVNSIERKGQEKQEEQADIEDKNSWEYLFKDYWTDLRAQLSITSEDLAQATSPWKGHDRNSSKQEASNKLDAANEDEGSGSESYPSADQTISKRRKTRSLSKSGSKQGDSVSRSAKNASAGETVEWASKELSEIVMHMRNGDRSFLPRSEVHSLLLEYIKRYNLRDPRRKSQVICDVRLQNLFGKPHVGHFEMLNLLDSHFLTKEGSQADDIQGSLVDVDLSNLDLDENYDTKTGKEKKRKSRRKGDSKGRQSNLDDYAAIDMHNINLIYLRRNLVEDLLDDPVTFHEKVVGSFLRLRIPGNQKQDLYRLVQVIGTSRVAEPYKVGKKTTDLVLEILNLNKTEVISIDMISNQDFTEDECKRLRQSIKCGLINRLSVGDVQEKAIMLQEVRVKNWLEAEILRLSHLRDRASDMGRRKELRECVEKLQLLQSPEERQRRIEEIPQIHADPNMDPRYESEDEDEPDDKEQDNYLRPRGSGFSRRGREAMSPRRGGYGSNDLWSGTRSMSSKGLLNKGNSAATGSTDMVNDNIWSSARDRELQRSLARDREPQQLINRDRPRSVSFSDTVARAAHSALTPDSSSGIVSEASSASPFTGVTKATSQINESEKMWHYKDPSGKIQGPFSMVQLRKWNNSGYFPADLRIWKTNEKPEESILLTNALAGKFQKDPLPVDSYPKAQMALYPGHSLLGSSGQTQLDISSSKPRVAPASIGIPKYSQDVMSSGSSLPSPTPNQTPTSARRRPFESRWSPTPAQQSASISVPNQLMPHSSPSPSSLRGKGGMESSVLSHGSRLASSPEISVLSTSANLPLMQSQIMVSSEAQKLLNPITQSSETSLPSTISGSGAQNWGSAQPQKPFSLNSLPSQIPIHGHAASSQESPQSMSVGNPVGNFSSQNQLGCPPSDPWRSPAPSQPNVQAPAPANIPWGTNMSNTQGAAPRPGSENQNTGWGPMTENPNMRWGGPMLPSTNVNWAATAPVSSQVNTNPGWFGPSQMQGPGNSNATWGMTGQVPAPGNAMPNWASPGQMLQPINGNPSWAAPSQGPALGNPNRGWVPPSGNQMYWPNQQNQSGAGFVSSGSHGGNSGYGGNSWNGQSQFGGGGGDGGSLRAPSKSQRVCKFYHETGHCKKGAGCDYLHN